MRPHQGTRSRISAGPAFPKLYKKSSKSARFDPITTGHCRSDLCKNGVDDLLSILPIEMRFFPVHGSTAQRPHRLAGVGGIELSDPEKPPLEHGLTATEGRSARHIHCRMDWTGVQITLWQLSREKSLIAKRSEMKENSSHTSKANGPQRTTPQCWPVSTRGDSSRAPATIRASYSLRRRSKPEAIGPER
jgi:hypothetical protein